MNSCTDKSIIRYFGILLIIIVNFNCSDYKVDYYENGNIKSEGRMLNNRLEGVWTYYNAGGSVRRMLQAKDGRLDGVAISYNSNGTISGIENYRKGQSKGVSILFDGKENYVSSICYVDNNIQNGYKYDWHNNQKLRSQGKMTNNLQEGTWLYYTEGGKLEMERVYNKGKIIEKKTYSK